ncbi:MAG: TolC family protein, partial [Solirubrobacterales bacterium]
MDRSRRTARVGWGVAVFLILGLAGCGTPEVEREPALAALAAKLDTIETVRLQEQSKSEPLTIEQATQQVAREIAEPNQTERTVELTLDEVRAAALANNLDLKVSMIDPAIAQAGLDAERAKFESVFFGSATYTRDDRVEGGAVSSRGYEAGVSTPLHTGGQIVTSVPIAESDGVSDAAASVSIDQPLLEGAGMRVNLYSIQLAAYTKDSIDAATKLRTISILSNADIAYWYLYSARKQLEVSREQYKLAQDQLENARHKVEAGSAAKIEIVRAEAGMASRLDTMISAETAVRDYERNLKRIMNRPDLPLNTQIDMIPKTDPDPKGMELDQEKLVAAALENRMEMAELEFSLARDDIYVAQAKNNLLPTLDASYTFAAGGQADDTRSAIGNVFDDTLANHSVGLTGQIPLGNGVAQARLRQARLSRVQTRLSRDVLEQEIRQEVYDAADGIEQDWRRILAAEQGVVRAHRSYKVEQSQFQLGQRTSTEVLDAASSLAEAQLRKIDAFVSYEISQVVLARATGTLLG